MPIATRTFRVFVSSTFEDLKAERDALQREVFPKLRTLCEQHGARFQAIDLRWGVRDEAALDQQTMEICLREIERCQRTGVKPNFIVLLGDRYGWLPLPARIPAAELDPRPVAGDWYKLDENAEPAECVLQPRTGIFTNADIWSVVEQLLHARLEAGARAAGITGPELSKYTDSATHQEIMAGLGGSNGNRQHVFGFFRKPSGETDARLEAVKSLVPNRMEFAPGDLQTLCDTVYDRLSRVIEAEVKRFEDRPALDLEVDAHDRFAEERCRIFTGRQAVLETIADYIRGPERRPLVLHGESGSGKSAVMAKASQQYKGPGRVIRRFIGASPESASGRALLTSLCKQMAPGETPVDYAELENAFKERLSAAAAEQPLVLFIDALDQLAAGDPARDVTWLPAELPAHVKVILSITDDGGRLPEGLPVRLERMARSEGGQALDELLQEARRTLQPWQRATVLAHFERCGLPLYLTLAAGESKVWKSYTSRRACKLGEGVAGVIDTLFDRLASNANHGPVLVGRSLGYLAAARYGLTEDEVLDVLTADDAVWSDFDQRKHHDVSERRLPVVVWSRLSLDLEPYLTERAAPGGTVIAFYHRQLAERVAGRFLAGAELRARHSDLARHFGAKPAWLDEGRKAPNARRAVELAFQRRAAQQWTEAEATLFDSQFLFAKVGANLVLDLDADYQALLQDAPEMSLPRHAALRLIHGALRLSLHVVAQEEAQFASQTVGRLLAHRDKPDVRNFVEELTAAAPRPWFRPLHPCFDSPGGVLLRTLQGPSVFTNGVATTAGGKQVFSASLDGKLRVWDLESGRVLRTLEGHSMGVTGVAATADGKTAISASHDHTLKVWDLRTGRAFLTLEGHTAGVAGVAVTPDGKTVVSASYDNTLKVWDLSTGRAFLTLEGHTAGVAGVAVTPDGKTAVSASGDHTLKVWDLESGRTLDTLEGHSDWVCGVAVTADGKRAVSASYDHTLKVWDLESGRVVRTLEGHSMGVTGVAVTADGKTAVSASGDHTLKVWDLESGRTLDTLEGHSDWVCGVAVTADGKRVLSESWDGTLKVWDLDTGRALRTLEGHSDWVCGVAVTADGKRAVSASRDNTLKVWDLESGHALRTLAGHSDPVLGVAVAADGRRAVSTSYNNTLKVWDLHTGRPFLTLEGSSDVVGGVAGVAVTPDGRRVVSASYDNTLKVWDLRTGRAWRTMEGHTAGVDGVAVTADGKRAISASRDNTLKVWDLESGHALRTLAGHSDWVTAVAVTANGERAVSTSRDNTLKVWDLESGRTLRTLEGHSAPVFAVAVTPNGKRAVSASDDHTLKVWNLDEGRLIVAFYCETYAACCACAGEQRIVAGDCGGRVYFLEFEE